MPDSKIAVYVLPADEDRIIAEPRGAPGRRGLITRERIQFRPETGIDVRKYAVLHFNLVQRSFLFRAERAAAGMHLPHFFNRAEGCQVFMEAVFRVIPRRFRSDQKLPVGRLQ